MLNPTDIEIYGNIRNLTNIFDLFETPEQRCLTACLMYEYLLLPEVIKFIKEPNNYKLKTAIIKNANRNLQDSHANKNVIDICNKYINIMDKQTKTSTPLLPIPILSQYAPVRRSARIAAQKNF